MPEIAASEIARRELERGLRFTKCLQCGCMRDTLDQIGEVIPSLTGDRAVEIREALPGWEAKMRPIRYACLGCAYCYAGAAQNAFTTAYPETAGQLRLSCAMETSTATWPPIVGEYFTLDPAAPVAVTTLASPDLSRQLAEQKIPGLAIAGKLETENIGIDKLIKNTISNPNLRFLVVCGAEPAGHRPGQTLLALAENGSDENGRVIGAEGKRPVLRNVSLAEIAAFRRQVQLVDLIGCESSGTVGEKIAELRGQRVERVGGVDSRTAPHSGSIPSGEEIPVITAAETGQPVRLDRAGYFVIQPLPGRKILHVEHYSNDNRLLHVVEGASARSLYLVIIAREWVKEMSHAAYLGKELARAELSLSLGIPYNQDSA